MRKDPFDSSSNLSNNQKLWSTGEIDAVCRGIKKSLTDVYCDIIPREAIYDLVCQRAQAGSAFLYTFARVWWRRAQAPVTKCFTPGYVYSPSQSLTASQCLCKGASHCSELKLDWTELRVDSNELFNKLCLEKQSILLFQLSLNAL